MNLKVIKKYYIQLKFLNIYNSKKKQGITLIVIPCYIIYFSPIIIPIYSSKDIENTHIEKENKLAAK